MNTTISQGMLIRIGERYGVVVKVDHTKICCYWSDTKEQAVDRYNKLTPKERKPYGNGSGELTYKHIDEGTTTYYGPVDEEITMNLFEEETT